MSSVGKLAGVFVLGSMVLAAAGSQEHNSTVKFEVRLAESQPVEGLKEASIEGSKMKVYLHKEAVITNKDVVGALVMKLDDQSPAVEIALTEDGARNLGAAIETHQGKPLAIIADGKVLFAPTVRSKIAGSKVVVTGNFTEEEAARIAKGISSK